MTLLLVFAVLIAIASAWFLARPLRAEPVAMNENGDPLIQLRDRLLAQLREIDVESGDRNIDATVAADERRRLEAELAQVLKSLAATKSADADAPAASGRRLWLPTVITLAIGLPLVSAGIYFARNSETLAQLGQGPTVAGGQVPPMVLQMVARLEARLAEQPADPKGWAQLARAYSVLGRASEARQAYARAYDLAPKDQEILSAYGEFLLSLDPGRPSPEAVTLFQKLYALDPENPAALWTLGLVAYHEQKFAQSVKYWERLLKQLPPDSEATPEIKHAIETARAQAKKSK